MHGESVGINPLVAPLTQPGFIWVSEDFCDKHRGFFRMGNYTR